MGCRLLNWIQERLNVELRLKWPNDLLTLEGKKVAGILCENWGKGVGVGLGINLASRIPLETAASLNVDVRSSKDLEILARQWIDYLECSPRELLVAAIQSAVLPQIGSGIEWSEKGAVHTGKMLGLGEYGELRVQNSDGQIRHLYSEEIKLLKL